MLFWGLFFNGNKMFMTENSCIGINQQREQDKYYIQLFFEIKSNITLAVTETDTAVITTTTLGTVMKNIYD